MTFGPCHLSVTEAACRRGERVIFEQVTFRVESGGLLQICGANGAGKTSLLRCMAGLLPLTTGAVEFQPAESAGSLHFCGEATGILPALSVEETVKFWSAILGCDDPGQALQALDVFELSAWAATPAFLLSAGQKRRLALCRLALSSRPLWLLDEPFNALDARARHRLEALLRSHRAAGGLAVVATHEALPFATHTLNLGEA